MLPVADEEDDLAEILNPGIECPVVLVCDHASNFIPPELDSLGLSKEQLDEHIAWDIGIADLTRALAHRWNGPAVLCGFSRLILDPNRPEDSATLIPPISEHHVIPGNRNLAPNEKCNRIARYHRPYHATLKAALDNVVGGRREEGLLPAVICPHSFTPVFHGERRPWHLSIMWDQDSRLAAPLISHLRNAGYVVGDNEPYSAKQETGHTMRTLCERHGLPGAMIEVRQDLIDTAEGVAQWSDIVGSAIEVAVAGLQASSSPSRVSEYARSRRRRSAS